MKRRLFVFTCLFITGLFMGWSLQIDVYIWLILATANMLVLLLQGFKQKRINIYTLYLLYIITGAFWFTLAMFPQDLYDICLGECVHGQGTIITYPKQVKSGNMFVIKVKDITSSGKELRAIERVMLKCSGEIHDLQPGDLISFKGELKKPATKRNPGGFDYRGYLKAQQIFYEVCCKNNEIKVIVQGKGLKTWAAKERKNIMEQIDKLLPHEEKALLQGMIFGDTSNISDENWELYRKAGVVHLFAVSGFHLSIIMGIIWTTLSIFKISPLPRLIFGILVLLVYNFFIGWSVSLIRASVMAFLILMAFAINKKVDLLTNLAMAALLILIVYPGQILMSGFQLSFGATFGIIYLYPYLQRYKIHKMISMLLAVQFMTLPIVIYHYHLISLFIPLTNVIATILGGLIVTSGFVGCIFGLVIPLLAEPFFIIAGVLSLVFSNVICCLGSLEWAGVVFSSPSAVFLVLYYIILFLLPYKARWYWILKLLSKESKALLIAVIISIFLFFCWPENDKMKVVFLDVGQGDAMFIITPAGNTLLIDGGGTPFSDFSIGKNILYPFLLNEGIREIDMVLLSHFDMDHGEGLLEVMEYIKVDQFLIPPAENNNLLLNDIKKKCRLEGTPIIEVSAGRRILLDSGIYIEVLYPPREVREEGNDRSLILRMVYKETEWLFTGDIENEALAYFMTTNNRFYADVLKLPHHGSISSYNEKFYSLVDPRVVVVSSGNNTYMHPHPTIMKYFKVSGIPVYLTKEKGAIITVSDGKKIGISTILP